MKMGGGKGGEKEERGREGKNRELREDNKKD